MADLKSKAIRNSLNGLLIQLVMIPVNFLLRIIILKYIGVEILGISGTIQSLVGILSLAEGGISAAISYCLYKPLVEKHYDGINEYISAYRRFYSIIAFVVLGIGIVLSFFLRFFLKDVDINGTVYGIFYLDLLNSVVSYLICYRRTLFTVDMKNYICNNVDTACKLVFMSLGTVLVYLTRNYLFYLGAVIANTITANVIIHFLAQKMYPFLHQKKANKNILKEIISYSKQLIFGNVSSYIFNSTDNIVISMSSKTINVGYLSNYTMISTYLRDISASFLGGIGPAVGQKQVNSDLHEKRNIYLKYSQICFITAISVCTPLFVLLDYFIGSVYGEEYVMKKSISLLVTLIIYVYLVPTAYGTLVVTNGKFDVSKNADFSAAIVNLVSSIVLANIFGIEGVLAGTVIGSIMGWLVRGKYVLTDLLEYSKWKCVKRIVKEIYCIFLLAISISVSKFISDHLGINNFIIKFIVIGIISIVISEVVYFMLYRFRDRIKLSEILGLFLKYAKGKFKHE